jgi:TfoX/Sxy family transcriptional regulator of competence genes
MGYYEVPADVLEDPPELNSWTSRALDVAAAAAKNEKSGASRGRATPPCENMPSV